MIFRKMYCHNCGSLLKKEKITKTYKKGDQEYSNRILGHPTLGMSEISKSQYVYKCTHCGSQITYEDQCSIAKTQKALKKKILK